MAVDGELAGAVVLTCQRCMNALELPLHEQFKVVLVQDEAELELEPGGYEAVLADPVRLDLQMLAEDQALLALPLVPRHDVGTVRRRQGLGAARNCRRNTTTTLWKSAGPDA